MYFNKEFPSEICSIIRNEDNHENKTNINTNQLSKLEELKGQKLTDKIIKSEFPEIEKELQAFKGQFFGGSTNQSYFYVRNNEERYLLKELLKLDDVTINRNEDLVKITKAEPEYIFNIQTKIQLEKNPFFIKINLEYQTNNQS